MNTEAEIKQLNDKLQAVEKTVEKHEALRISFIVAISVAAALGLSTSVGFSWLWSRIATTESKISGIRNVVDQEVARGITDLQKTIKEGTAIPIIKSSDLTDGRPIVLFSGVFPISGSDFSPSNANGLFEGTVRVNLPRKEKIASLRYFVNFGGHGDTRYTNITGIWAESVDGFRVGFVASDGGKIGDRPRPFSIQWLAVVTYDEKKG